MGDNIIYEGWVHLRSRILKKWKRRWLILTNESLCMYQAPNHLQYQKQIPIRSISEISPSSQETGKDHSFKLETYSRSYYFISSTQVTLFNWINKIKQQLSLASTSENTNLSLQEIQGNNQMSLIKVFNVIKTSLLQRQEQLMQKLDQAQFLLQQQAQKQIQILSNLLSIQQTNQEKIKEITKQKSSLLNQIRKIQELPHKCLNMKDLEDLQITERLNINQDIVTALIENNTVVNLINPYEFRIRRSEITRALKWRYTGNRIDALTFMVSQDVQLTAIGVCRPHKEGRVVTVGRFQILKGNSTSSKNYYSHEAPVPIEYSALDSIYKINLLQPIAIKKNNPYTVFLCIQGNATYKCVDCQKRIYGPGPVQWEFSNTVFAPDHQNNRCDTICGPICDFYFI